jgi:hypothetical protein
LLDWSRPVGHQVWSSNRAPATPMQDPFAAALGCRLAFDKTIQCWATPRDLRDMATGFHAGDHRFESATIELKLESAFASGRSRLLLGPERRTPAGCVELCLATALARSSAVSQAKANATVMLAFRAMQVSGHRDPRCSWRDQSRARARPIRLPRATVARCRITPGAAVSLVGSLVALLWWPSGRAMAACEYCSDSS